jgi:hypothetical protein
MKRHQRRFIRRIVENNELLGEVHALKGPYGVAPRHLDREVGAD